MTPLKIQEQKPLKERLAEFALAAGFTSAAVLSLGFVHEQEAQKREQAAYASGYKLAQAEAKSAQDNIRVDAGTIALQWWAGTSDMKEVRERLCTNVSAKSFIGTDWRKELLHSEQRGVVVSLKFKSQQGAAEYLRYVGKL